MEPSPAKTVKLEAPAKPILQVAPVDWLGALFIVTGWLLVALHAGLLAIAISERMRAAGREVELPALSLENLGLMAAEMVGMNFLAMLGFLSFLLAGRSESKRTGMSVSALLFVAGAVCYLVL